MPSEITEDDARRLIASVEQTLVVSERELAREGRLDLARTFSGLDLSEYVARLAEMIEQDPLGLLTSYSKVVNEMFNAPEYQPFDRGTTPPALAALLDDLHAEVERRIAGNSHLTARQ